MWKKLIIMIIIASIIFIYDESFKIFLDLLEGVLRVLAQI